MQTLNSMLNRIHEWGEFDQHPMMRMFLTRSGGIALATTETCAVFLECINVGIECGRTASALLAKSISIIYPGYGYNVDDKSPITECQAVRQALLNVCKLIIGLASTILIGIFLSPEINFRIHLRLGLTVDNLALKKEKELKAKYEAEIKAAEIAKARTARIEQFREQIRAAKEAEEQENAIDERLAELLTANLVLKKA